MKYILDSLLDSSLALPKSPNWSVALTTEVFDV